MNRLILAAVLLFGTLPLHAQTPDCLPQPTQDCAFQLALRQADDEGWARLIAYGYLAVANRQELEQTGEADETRAALLVQLASRNPEPPAIIQALKAGQHIAALATGDADIAWRLLSMIKPFYRVHSLDVAVDAAFVRGPEPVEALMTLMPPEEQAEVLYALGKAQIRVGDVDGVASTIERLGNPVKRNTL